MDLTGRRFGKLVAIRQVENRGRFVRWLCRCDCGNEKVIQSRHLTSGGTRICRTKGFHSRIGRGEAAFNIFFNSTRGNAEKRGYVFEITREQAKEISQRNCFYCGIPPSHVVKAKTIESVGDFVYNGIDRVDNRKGYILDNVVACCGRCNWCKSDKGVDEFKNWVASVYNNWAKF